MIVGNMLHQSFADEEDKVLAAIFFQGCNFNCKYCHNPELIDEDGPFVHVKDLVDNVLKNNFLIDGVLITGGEPVCQPLLVDLLKELKKHDVWIVMNTNGTGPAVLYHIWKHDLVDKITLDVKAPSYKYRKIVRGKKKDPARLVDDSIQVVNNFEDAEFRFTYSPELFKERDVRAVLQWLKRHRARHPIYIQGYRGQPGKAPKYREPPLSMLKELALKFKEELDLDVRYR